MAKNRSLRGVHYRLGKIDSIIEQIIDENGHADVLEVGCGYGLPMLELKKRFKDKINIAGINKKAEFNLPKKALWEGIKQGRFYPWSYFLYEKRFGFPRYVNCDASLRLPFDDDSFDFIYSIASTFFFSDKIHFLQEINRILIPDRTARIHFGHSAIEAGHYKNEPDPPYDNLCEIRTSEGNVIDVEKYFESFNFMKMVEQEKTRPKYLEIHKIEREVDLGLTYLDSCLLTDINPNWIGFVRSVYSKDNKSKSLYGEMVGVQS